MSFGVCHDFGQERFWTCQTHGIWCVGLRNGTVWAQTWPLVIWVVLGAQHQNMRTTNDNISSYIHTNSKMKIKHTWYHVTSDFTLKTKFKLSIFWTKNSHKQLMTQNFKQTSNSSIFIQQKGIMSNNQHLSKFTKHGSFSKNYVICITFTIIQTSTWRHGINSKHDQNYEHGIISWYDISSIQRVWKNISPAALLWQVWGFGIFFKSTCQPLSVLLQPTILASNQT